MAENKNYAVGLDVGSAWTRCLIAEVVDGCLEFRGHGLVESKGWIKGRVSDQKAITESVRLARWQRHRWHDFPWSV